MQSENGSFSETSLSAELRQLKKNTIGLQRDIKRWQSEKAEVSSGAGHDDPWGTLPAQDILWFYHVLILQTAVLLTSQWNNPHWISVWDAPLETAAAGWGFGMLLADLGEQRELCKRHLETCCKAWSCSLRFPLPLWVSATCVHGEEASMEDLGDVLLAEETRRCLCSWGAQPHPFP